MSLRRPAERQEPIISDDRSRRALLSGVSLSLNRLLGIVISLLLVPLVARTLSAEAFGVWLLISSLGGLLGFLDFGVSNGLVSRVAVSTAEGNLDGVSRLMSSAWSILLRLATALFVVSTALVLVVDWRGVFGVSDDISRASMTAALLIFVTAFSANLPLGLAPRVQQGLQQSHQLGVWSAIGGILSLAAGVLGAVRGAGLPWFVFVSVSAPMVANVLSTTVLLWKRRELRPRRSLVDPTSKRVLINSGWLFFVLSLAGAVGYQSDSIIISSRLGAAEVPNYAVPMRMFMLAPVFVGLFVSPLWAAYADAAARRDWAWVRRVFRRSLLLSFAATSLSGAVLLVAGPWILDLWVGDAVEVSTGVLLAMALVAVIHGVSGPPAMLLNGMNVVGFQAVTALAMAVLNIGLSLLLVDELGVAGPVLATAFSQAVCILVPSAIYLRQRFFRNLG